MLPITHSQVGTWVRHWAPPLAHDHLKAPLWRNLTAREDAGQHLSEFPCSQPGQQEQPHSRIAVAARSPFTLTARLSGGADKGSVKAGVGQGQPGLSRS